MISWIALLDGSPPTFRGKKGLWSGIVLHYFAVLIGNNSYFKTGAGTNQGAFFEHRNDRRNILSEGFLVVTKWFLDFCNNGVVQKLYRYTRHWNTLQLNNTMYTFSLVMSISNLWFEISQRKLTLRDRSVRQQNHIHISDTSCSYINR